MKMQLTIETENEARGGDVENAYEEAMDTCGMNEFIASLEENIGDSIVGRGSNHVWISEKSTGERIAIVTNLLN